MVFWGLYCKAPADGRGDRLCIGEGLRYPVKLVKNISFI